MDQLDALEAEAAKAGSFLDALSPPEWGIATRCEPLTLLEMAAHMLRGADRMLGFATGPAAGGEPQKDAASYFRYDAVAAGPGVVSRAQEDASQHSGESLLDAWHERWPAAIQAAADRMPEDPVVASPLGTIRLSEYVRTRCVELVVHHMDLRDALGLAPAPTEAGLWTVVGLLEEMLGRDLGTMDPTDFVLSGTGRRPLDPSERAAFGPDAAKFPLLA